MRVMVIVVASKESEAGVMPTEAELSAMTAFNEELVKAGVMVAGEGLHPSKAGKRVVFAGGKPAVIDGPFTESKELVAGFWIWQVKSMDEALAWAKRCPPPMPGQQGVLEIRPVFEAADFGDALTPELREKEDAMRKELESRN
jgi:hypothetical protein